MVAASSGQQRLLVMPDDGSAAVVELIDQAREELLLKQFKLQSEQIVQALFRARERGVRVRVMLTPPPPAATAGTMKPLLCCRAMASRWCGLVSASRSPTKNQW